MRVGNLGRAAHPFWMPELSVFGYFFSNSEYIYMVGLIHVFLLLLIQTSHTYKSINGSYLYWDSLKFVTIVLELHTIY